MTTFQYFLSVVAAIAVGGGIALGTVYLTRRSMGEEVERMLDVAKAVNDLNRSLSPLIAHLLETNPEETYPGGQDPDLTPDRLVGADKTAGQEVTPTPPVHEPNNPSAALDDLYECCVNKSTKIMHRVKCSALPGDWESLANFEKLWPQTEDGFAELVDSDQLKTCGRCNPVLR